MPHLLGIDIGTSGTKTLLCDDKGKVLATAMAEQVGTRRPSAVSQLGAARSSQQVQAS